MKTASKVFLIIGLIASLIVIGYGIYLLSYTGPGYLLYGIYSLFTSILGLCAIGSSSKGFVVFAGVLYIPVILLASIFMFCIKEEDLY